MRNHLGSILEDRFGVQYRKDRANAKATRADDQLPEAKPAGSKKDSRPTKKNNQVKETAPAPESVAKDSKNRSRRNKTSKV